VRLIDVGLTERRELSIGAEEVDVPDVVCPAGKPGVPSDAWFALEVGHCVDEEGALLIGIRRVVAGELGEPDRLGESLLVRLEVVDQPLGVVPILAFAADVDMNADRVDAAAGAGREEVVEVPERIGVVAGRASAPYGSDAGVGEDNLTPVRGLDGF